MRKESSRVFFLALPNDTMFDLDQVLWTLSLDYSLFRFQKTPSKSKLCDSRPSLINQSRTPDPDSLIFKRNFYLNLAFYTGNSLMFMKSFENHGERY